MSKLTPKVLLGVVTFAKIYWENSTKFAEPLYRYSSDRCDPRIHVITKLPSLLENMAKGILITFCLPLHGRCDVGREGW